jgi:hypothetical protein
MAVNIEGVWATLAASEAFSDSERQGCIDDYSELGPQYFTRGVGFAFYKFTDGRSLLLADKGGKVSVMTQEELAEAGRAVGKRVGPGYPHGSPGPLV